jgi:hypothetical protein
MKIKILVGKSAITTQRGPDTSNWYRRRLPDAVPQAGIYGHVVGDEQRNAVQNRSMKLLN